ncbi:hypothetical protein EWM64_g338 [Hericium alpestre]|uniref:Alpha/beta hydrolase fold-3 domain-containing protein n=1 Tax=Hericium alpestre TaxID=135208 RepID=A0A4Z0AC98_9AGAM|nr:hypothetical protein EWM64_g338 [Hericium alpestre]
MTVSTTSAALHITPVVLKTFGKHWKHKTRRFKHEAQDEAKDDLLYDESVLLSTSFKSFIKLGTENTVESLQAFTNTHVPSPFWAVVVPVLIPLRSCNRAADLLIDWFGPEDLAEVVGGERWWQVRGLDGIDGEWVTEHKFLSGDHVDKNKTETTGDEAIRKMEKLETVMVSVYALGAEEALSQVFVRSSMFMECVPVYPVSSPILTAAQIPTDTRSYAMHGNLEAEPLLLTIGSSCTPHTQNPHTKPPHRKAPQYPWPCPLHDVLAAYFYLIEPPPHAKHKPVPPSKLVFAGDSAGAALCITALTVLRDMGLPLPAGAVLISPWVDMTHSFPSVMTNTPNVSAPSP